MSRPTAEEVAAEQLAQITDDRSGVRANLDAMVEAALSFRDRCALAALPGVMAMQQEYVKARAARGDLPPSNPEAWAAAMRTQGAATAYKWADTMIAESQREPEKKVEGDE
jgi:hypothetical protein